MSTHRRKRKKASKGKKKAKADYKHCPGKKSSKNLYDSQNTHSNTKVSVEKSKLMCRRYEAFHDHFLSYDQIIAFLEKTRKNYSTVVDLGTIGYSGQGKPIYVVLITTENHNSTSPKHATFIEAGLKGEDVFAVSNALYMIDYLAKNPNYIKIMDYLIVPCGNPDAYDIFIKSKAKDDNACTAKRSGSKTNCNIEEKKPRLQSEKSKKPEPNSAPCLSLPNNFGPNSSRSSYEELQFIGLNADPKATFEIPCQSGSKKPDDKCCKKPTRNNSKDNNRTSGYNKSDTRENQVACPLRMDLSLNFPVVLGLNDMRRIPTNTFLEKIKAWKENYVNRSPETNALLGAINGYQFAIKLLICLEEGGEAICYPFGFCTATSESTNDLKEVAKKGKCAIGGRNFQFGSIHDIRGLTYGCLIDFLQVDRSSIKYTYIIQVHKKTPKYNEAQELKQLTKYGCQITECVKRMSTAVFKYYTNMTGNKKVETERTKHGLAKKSSW